MPLLPTRNNLDYNPNSIVNASKTIKTIALENMKNPVLDPDMKTLSSMDAERNLKVNLEEMEKMYIDIESDLMKLSQFTGISVARRFQEMVGSGRYNRMCGGAGSTSGSENSAYAGLSSLTGLFTEPRRARGRPKGSKNKATARLTASNLPQGQRTIASFFGSRPSGTPSVSSSSSTRFQRRTAQQGRFQPVLTPFTQNPQARANGDPDDSDPDDDASSLPSSASFPSSRTNRSMRSGRSVPSSQGSRIDDDYNPFSVKNVISNLLIEINRKVQRLDFFFNSRIKPAFRKFSASQQGFLASFLQTIYGLYNNVFREVKEGSYIEVARTNLEGFIMSEVDNGDDLLAILKKSLDKLILDLSVGLNASKQASTGESTTINTELADNYALELAGFVGSGRKPRKPKMMGCGRNFYGETINNSRDIPTIWTSVRDCPTKYLL